MDKKFEHRLRDFAGDHQETHTAIDEILRLGGKSFDNLIEMVGNSKIDAELRGTICWLFRMFKDQRAVPVLVKALEDDNANIRYGAALALGDLQAKSAVSTLLRVMVELEDHQTRSLAAYALGEIGEATSWALFIERMMDIAEVPSVRAHIIEALTYLKVEANQSISYLIELLRDDAAEVRFWACYSLGSLGNEVVIPDLEALAANDEAIVPNWWSVSKEAYDSIERIREQMKYQDEE